MKSFDFDRVITTGANGMIGSYVDFGIRTDHAELDVMNSSEVSAFIQRHKPTAILHLAGATDMERCERDPSYAYDINVVGTLNVARAAAEIGAALVYVSTSRVFSGTKNSPYSETDLPEPTTHYGRSKRIGELIAESLVVDHLIVRTCWVFGGGPKRDNKFFGNVIRQLGNPEIKAICDVHGSPTFGKDLIAEIRNLLLNGRRGYIHVSNAGVATRAGIAREIVLSAGSKAVVREVTKGHFSSGSSLPKNEAIVSSTVNIRSWQDALREYINTEWEGYLSGVIL